MKLSPATCLVEPRPHLDGGDQALLQAEGEGSVQEVRDRDVGGGSLVHSLVGPAALRVGQVEGGPPQVRHAHLEGGGGINRYWSAGS